MRQQLVAAILVPLTLLTGSVVTESQASIVEKQRAFRFLKKRQQCDVWFVGDLAPQLPGHVSNEVSCLFYGTVGSGSIEEETGCLWAKLDLETGRLDAGPIPTIVPRQRCTPKAIAKLFSPSPTVPGGFDCDTHSSLTYIFGGRRNLIPFLKKRFAACATFID